MRTYGTYKDSGISWLGLIPSHWDMIPIRHILQLKKRIVGDKANLYTLLSLTLQGIIKRDLDNPKGKFPSSFDAYQVVEKNDFVFCNFDNEETPRAVGLSAFDGMITGAYDVFSCKNDNANIRFLNYYFLNIDEFKRFKPLYKGLRKSIPIDALLTYKVAMPPLAEQEAIVAYLDGATAEIDKAIASQQRMVELLQERKQIIINQAVTQGLNPDVPMKPTNIDWLPQIPSHWQLKKNKYVVLLKSGQNLTSEQIEKDDLYPVYGGNGLRGYYSDYNNDGDYVLIGRQGALCGNINYAHNKFWATEHAVVCYPVDRLNVLWLGETLRAMNLNRYATASAQPGLAVENIKGLMMPVPDYKEQNDIADYIEKQTKPIDDSIERCNKMIGALTERKQILINDVITGKIKV